MGKWIDAYRVGKAGQYEDILWKGIVLRRKWRIYIRSYTTEKKQTLLRFLRDELQITSVKDGCSQGVGIPDWGRVKLIVEEVTGST